MSLCLSAVTVIGLFFAEPSVSTDGAMDLLFMIVLGAALLRLFLADATGTRALRRPGSLYSLR